MASRGSGREDQRGAVAVFVALTLALLMIVTAFAVDLGMQRVARRDAQATADIVSIDLAREIDGRAKKDYSQAALDRAFAQSLARNSGGFGADPEQFAYELGALDAEGHFQAVGPNTPVDAVRVTTVGTVGYLFTGGSGRVERSAVASSLGGGCFKLGSYAARVDLGDAFILGPLVGVLGTDVDLSLLDAQGLVGADIQLVDLLHVPRLGVATFDELATLPITLGDFYLAMADVLARESGQTAQVALLQQLATVPIAATRVTVGQIIDLGTGTSSGLQAALNVFDLVATGAFVANGDSVLDVPDLNLSVPGLANVRAEVRIGQKPQPACGRKGTASTSTSQVDIDLSANLSPGLNIDVLGLVGARATGAIALSLRATPAEGTLRDIQCDDDARVITVEVGSGLLDLEIGVGLDVSATLVGARIPVAKVDLGFGTTRSAAPTNVVITVEDGDYDVRQSVGDGSLGVPGLVLRRSTVTALGVLPIGGLVTALVTPLLGVLNPLVQRLDSVLLSPLLEAMGLNIAGADVYPVATPECDVPVLQE